MIIGAGFIEVDRDEKRGGCPEGDPAGGLSGDLYNTHTMVLVDRRLWEKRKTNPVAIEEELRGPKGRGGS